MTTFPWPQWTDRLKALHADGLSAAQIAEALSKESRYFCNRNQVIGRLHRCGLLSSARDTWSAERIARLKELRESGAGVRRIAREFELSPGTVANKIQKLGMEARLGAAMARTRRHPVKKSPPAPYPPPLPRPYLPPPPVEYILGQGKPLWELASHECRWALNDCAPSETIFFCASPKHGDLPYCEAHAKRAYNAPMERILQGATERLKKTRVWS